jgi:hypothetical protein
METIAFGKWSRRLGLVREASRFWRKADIPRGGIVHGAVKIFDSENPKVFEVMSRCRVVNDVLF